MWRALRVAVLLFILATVAQAAWLARARTTEWNGTLRIVIYPVNADGSPASTRYIAELGGEVFEPIALFFRQEGEKYRLGLREPVAIRIAPALASVPPAAPFGGGRLEVIVWSLKLRYWAYMHDTHKGARPDVRLFVSYYDPALRPRLPHSTGLQKGLIGVVNAFARQDMSGSNNVVIAHELLHTFGASDKYDPANNRPLFPDGYADPGAQPLYPQARAEIMAGRIPLAEDRAEVPAGMEDVAIGTRTAREINWLK